ncbi:phosphoribosylglycinamide formyltransferase [Wolbachia endosymbiont of Atemnus politus]|uniref:phosphoribosylglycinamide formyltransferase n=1 Tax=Wolbachia endosymbiont of Atemnus politus TaxID=2682840 RepID=UPI0015748848|nr:phosphoribosylglycinamide formyltransferase [Wolbachia endosymbiont of Atemnus politus]NSM56430.1 phosphoribosylglycinamide formyltransferase [Wolbachia endosymbiont of Atemnus politus]NSX83204.1 phosphoribosylglycinamide formyltransferase [Wolbachia endosymbiont of Atemnus politus]
MKKIKLGVLISGRGSNMQALIKACQDRSFPAEVVCVITNNGEATGLEIAKQAGITAFIVENKPLDVDRIHEVLVQHAVDLICLAGFMRILKADFLSKWHNKVINIHPSLLPSFKGLNAQEQALKAGVKITGCTVHYVTPEVDAGTIITQAAVPVLSNDNIHSLSERILAEEHKCYVEAVRLIAEDMNH